MIKYETIISNFDDKVTLYNWLRKVEEALKKASATNFVVNKKGNATLSFSITFADGTTLESGDIVLQQGESVDQARIASGILQLHLTNGTWLTAGNVKPVTNFEIDASQHLIVNYADGTSEDLGAIFSGNVNISGNLSVSGTISQALDNVYNLSLVAGNANLTLTDIYSKIIIKNNILYVVVNFKLKNQTESEIVSQAIVSANVSLPSEVANNIYDLAGNNGSATLVSPCGVCSVIGIDSGNIQLSDITSQKVTLSLVKQNAPRTYGVLMRNNDGYRIPAGATRYLTARMMLTL